MAWLEEARAVRKVERPGSERGGVCAGNIRGRGKGRLMKRQRGILNCSFSPIWSKDDLFVAQLP